MSLRFLWKTRNYSESKWNTFVFVHFENFHFQDVLLEGYASHQLLLQLHDHILAQMALGNEQKAVIFEKSAVRNQLARKN